MSYDIHLKDRKTGEQLHIEHNHLLQGGTCAVGGTTELWLNVTYNYGEIFRKVLGEKGIRSIYGLGAVESLPILFEAVNKLEGKRQGDYWAATEGNAKAALLDLMSLVQLAIREDFDAVWDGD